MESFASWAELRDWLVASHERLAEHDGGALLTLRVAPDVTLGVRRLEPGAGAGPWVLLCVKIGPVARLRAFDALTAGFDLPIGHFFEHRGAIGVGQTLPLRRIDAATVTEVTAALTELTRDLRARFLAGADEPDDTGPFGHLAE
ncbi:MAG: hypothetical protein H6708_16765 [Kofleriaceae bacterium]|nr:hypothetical protein [Myxococcales bacterium]MCB9562057.1 hypothetical protein [Kofleriaceae bacterium]